MLASDPQRTWRRQIGFFGGDLFSLDESLKTTNFDKMM